MDNLPTGEVVLEVLFIGAQAKEMVKICPRRRMSSGLESRQINAHVDAIEPT